MPSVNLIQQNIEELLHVLKQYSLLINTHMVDYFTKNAYENCVPFNMRNEIEKLGYGTTIENIFADKLSVETPYLSNFVKVTQNLSLYNQKEICLGVTDLQKKLLDLGCNKTNGLKLKAFMNPKKSHEVEVLTAVIASLTKFGNVTHVVDIGDGKGYLSSLLSLHYKIPVLGIDASAINTTGAIKRAEKLGRLWPGILNTNKSMLPKAERKYSSNLLYKQVTQFVTEETNFMELISNVFMEECSNLGVVGLHTCGNLAPAALRIFSANEGIKTLCNVGCCYHLLSEKEVNSESYYGFPMSKYVMDKSYQLGRKARMLSAQSTDRIFHHKRLPNKNIFHRAVLEMLLDKRYPEYTSQHIGKFKVLDVTFPVYVRNAFEKLGIRDDISDEEVNQFYDSFACREKQLYTFNLLRCMVAPLIESLVLLDRLLYLHECGFVDSYLVRLFDPVISPRCYGIIAYKTM